jgi:SAP domain
MLADSSLLLQMQLALIGIVLVTGLFYLWRLLCRIEDKVIRLSAKVSNSCASGGGCCGGAAAAGMAAYANGGSNYKLGGSSAGGGGGPIDTDFRIRPLNFADADIRAEQLMKEVFGEDVDVAETITIIENEAAAAEANVMAAGGAGIGAGAGTGPETVEVVILTQAPAPKIPETSVIIDEIEPEPEAENTNPLSKQKLNKMSPDDLKNLCVQRGLSGEGNKKTLIDRLLGITRD